MATETKQFWLYVLFGLAIFIAIQFLMIAPILFFAILLVVPLALWYARFWINYSRLKLHLAGMIRVLAIIIVCLIGLGFIINLDRLGDEIGYQAIAGYHSHYEQEYDNGRIQNVDVVSIPTTSGWLLLYFFQGMLLICAVGSPILTWFAATQIYNEAKREDDRNFIPPPPQKEWCRVCQGLLDNNLAYCPTCGYSGWFFNVYLEESQNCANHPDREAKALCNYCALPVCAQCYTEKKDSISLPIYTCNDCAENMSRLKKAWQESRHCLAST